MPFARPAGFDLAQYWKKNAQAFSADRRFVAEVRVMPDTGESLRGWCRVLPAKPEDGPHPDGRVTLRVEFDDEAHARFVILGLGRRVEAIGPPAFVAGVDEEIAAVAAARVARLKQR